MKTSFPIFLAVFVALGASFGGFVVGGISQLGTEKQTAVLNSSDTYPVQRNGNATLGLQVYRAEGCAACHTTQVRQDGVACNVVMTGFGKKVAAVSNLISTLKLTNLNADEAAAVSDQITAAGGKSETHIVATGADISRGWGIRQSVAEDFLWDYPVQLGNLRAGPDLANVGARLGNADWLLLHLYAPQAVVKNSAMPPLKFLFIVRKMNGAPSPDALQLSGEFAPSAGFEVVPTDAAKNLAAYLLSLRADVPLHDAPFTPAAAPAAETKK